MRNSPLGSFFYENLSGDKSMVKYYDRHSTQQFIMEKPVRLSYGNWAATSSDGYCYEFNKY